MSERPFQDVSNWYEANDYDAHKQWYNPKNGCQLKIVVHEHPITGEVGFTVDGRDGQEWGQVGGPVWSLTKALEVATEWAETHNEA